MRQKARSKTGSGQNMWQGGDRWQRRHDTLVCVLVPRQIIIHSVCAMETRACYLKKNKIMNSYQWQFLYICNIYINKSSELCGSLWNIWRDIQNSNFFYCAMRLYKYIEKNNKNNVMKMFWTEKSCHNDFCLTVFQDVWMKLDSVWIDMSETLALIWVLNVNVNLSKAHILKTISINQFTTGKCFLSHFLVIFTWH